MRANRSTSVLAWKASPLLLGAVGVLCFSLTFPATHAAEASFSPVVVGLGRAVPAAALAAIILTARRQPLLPPREILGRMLIVAGTVGMAVLRAGERPRPRYWAALALGLAVVVGFAVIQGGGRLRSGDILLLIAIVVAGIGYTEG